MAGRREAIGDAVAALRGLRGVLFQAGNDDVAVLAGQLAELRALAGAGLAAATAEAEKRGIVAESQCASTCAWVAEYAWHSRRESATVTKAAALLLREDMTLLADAVATVDLDLPTAVTVGGEFDKLAPDLKVEARPVVLEQFIDIGAGHGPRGVRLLKEHLLARYGADGAFEDAEERCRRQINLSCGRKNQAGLWNYRLTLDNESHAVLQAAIGPGSAPRVDQETGLPDTRPAGHRRGEALIAALRRAQTAARHVPTSPKATLIVTIGYDDLVAQTGTHTVRDARGNPDTSGTTCSPDTHGSIGVHGATNIPGSLGACGVGNAVGTLADGTPLSPETVRRIACDAQIIPVVLGSRGAILNQGRAERLFTTAQIRALWQRDGHCSFPGCDAPAAWCDAHHLIHWVDGGTTNLDNATLLCPRHHSIVHRDRLAGHVTAGHVHWDRRPGSYQAKPAPPAPTPAPTPAPAPAPGSPPTRPEPPPASRPPPTRPEPPPEQKQSPAASGAPPGPEPPTIAAAA